MLLIPNSVRNELSVVKKYLILVTNEVGGRHANQRIGLIIRIKPKNLVLEFVIMITLGQAFLGDHQRIENH